MGDYMILHVETRMFLNVNYMFESIICGLFFSMPQRSH